MRWINDTPEERRQAYLEYEAKVRRQVTTQKWYRGWTNWFDAPPPANVEVEVMYMDGRRYGIKKFEDPANAWYPPIAWWWWRLAPRGLFYDPLSMDLKTFLLVRADLGPHKATEVWEEAHLNYPWVERPLPRDSALARIQSGELVV